ncbi:hypothetical protein [Nocardioides donggukensis]|uniref:Uncharacterized protein n=1 Tax=Nocardioides donggukensis TaxID=2774019 RepID=A0A927K1D9_9ACTN|nr:hypothetical protein [Nocardioides donggukensis]MBD8868452.1 hypothetical protein [Nocardioides donggukensis]
MALRVLRVGVAVLLGASGALICAASWQRWADACPWGERQGAPCDGLQDHRYDFVAPTAPWEPVGDAALLAGWSLLLLAVAFVALPWALAGRRPGIVSAVASSCAVLAMAAVGVATVRSALTGTPVDPIASELTVPVWYLVPPALLARFAIAGRGWGRVAAVWLILSTPLVAAPTYAVGPYDAQPWWEAVSGLFIVAASLCLVSAAAFGTGATPGRTPTPMPPRTTSAAPRSPVRGST